MVGAGPAGLTVAALVPEHQPADAAEVAALVMPATLIQCIAVAEDDGDRRVIRAVDLSMQRNAVVGEHCQDSATQFAERLRRHRIRQQPLSSDRYLLGCDDGTSPCRYRTSDQACHARDPPPPGHLTSRYASAPRDAVSSGSLVTPA